MNDTVVHGEPMSPLSSLLENRSPMVFDRQHRPVGRATRDPDDPEQTGGLRVELDPDLHEVIGEEATIEIPFRRIGAVRRDEIRLDTTLDALASEVAEG